MMHWATPTRILPKSWWHETSIEDRVEFVQERLRQRATLADIALSAEITVEALRKFCWTHRILGAAPRMVDRARVAMVPDDRLVDPKAWGPLGPAVGLVENTGCAWPVEVGGKQMCCGRTKSGRGSYCQEHHDIAYRRG